MPATAYGFLFAAVAAISLSALASATTEDERSLEKRGEALLDTNCSRCHAIGRTGTSPDSAAPAFRTLGKRYPIDGLAEGLAEGFSVGHSDMPEFIFEPDDIAAILSYLKSIQEP
jgi:mono/diheme cytochrome c family protein